MPQNYIRLFVVVCVVIATLGNAPLVVMLPSRDGGTPLLSSAFTRTRQQAWLLLHLLLVVLMSMPPLELAFHLPIPDCVVVVSILGSKGPTPSPAFVGRHVRLSRWWEADAGLLRPLPANTLHHPWKYCFLTPPSLDARRTRGLCAPGAQLPASSVRGTGARRGDDTVTLVGWGGGFVGCIASAGGVSWSVVFDGLLALVQEVEGSSSVRGNPPP